MPRRKRPFTKATHEKRLKEGRGQGDRAEYQPYIRVQDFSSIGQSNRDYGQTAWRQHDLFSKLEHRVSLIYDKRRLLDIKEQYPLPLEVTLEIARQCGIRHPADRWTKEPIPITTDLLLTVPLQIGSKRVARAVKPTKYLRKWRTIEKLELERRCWQHLNSGWGIITERDVNLNLVRNILWSYKFHRIGSLYPLSPDDVGMAAKMLTNTVLTKESPLCDSALYCDQLLGFRNGTCLSIVRHLIASRQWLVDMSSSPIMATNRLEIINVALAPN
jgi:hypothetical protein